MDNEPQSFTYFRALSPEFDTDAPVASGLPSRPSFFSRLFGREAPLKPSPASSQVSFRNVSPRSAESEISGALPFCPGPSDIRRQQNPFTDNPRLDAISVLGSTQEYSTRKYYPYTGATSSNSSLGRDSDTASLRGVDIRGNIAKISNILTESKNDAYRKISGSIQTLADPLSGRFDPETGQRLQDYNQSDYRQTWMPDRSGKECYDCNEKFSTFRRRHHCRICGQIFCSKCCCQGIPGKLLGYMGDLRLCNHCYETVSIQFKDSNLDVTKFTTEGGSPSPRPARKTTRTLSQSSVEDHSINIVGNARIYQQQQSVFDHLPKESSDEIAPAAKGRPQILSVADLMTSQVPLNDVENEENELFVDEFEPEWVRNIRPGEESTLSVPEVTVLDRQLNGNVSPFRNPSPFPSPSITRASLPSPVISTDNGSTTRTEGDCASVCSVAAVDGHDLQHLFDTQAVKLLKYILKREDLNEKKWLPVLWPLCQELAFTIQPNVKDNKDSMDVLDYLHVKALTSNVQKPYAQAIFGTAFCKSVADKRMRQKLLNPSVMIIGGSIEYERGGVKLCSMEPVLMQETQYLQNVVHKIALHAPSILVVEKGVANIAQHYIREKGITLVYNVKESVIKRIARCTRADILRTVESGVTKPRLGSCGSFRVVAVPCISGGNVDCHGTKQIMLFEDCQPDLACSLMLHANSYKNLRKAKRILKFMVSTVYSCKLETALLKSLHACVDKTRKVCSRQLSVSQTDLLNLTECEVCVENKKSEPELQEFDTRDPLSLCESLSKSTLTANPLQSLGLPYLETSLGSRCPLIEFFKKPLYRFKQICDDSVQNGLNNENEHVTENHVTVDIKRKIDQVAKGEAEDDVHKFLHVKMTNGASSISALGQVANFRAIGSKMFKDRYNESQKDGSRFKIVTDSKTKDRISPRTSPDRNQDTRDVLDPYNHQRLAVLFSSFCSKSDNAPGFCVDPWVVWMDFYAFHDLPLGNFLIMFCFNRNKLCIDITNRNKSCGLSMLDHVRKIVHGHASIEISTQTIMEDQDATHAAPDAILSWDYCGKCKMSTAASPINNDLWHLSFAKYLDYLFTGTHMHSHIAVGPQSKDASLCPHCLFHQHDHFFAFKNYVTCFKISPIKLYEVAFSPMQCKLDNYSIVVKKLVHESMNTSEDAGALFTKMLESIVAFRNHTEAAKFGTTQKELSKIQEEGQEYFRAQVNQVQELLTALPTHDHAAIDAIDEQSFQIKDGLERCRYILATAIEKWNREVNRFYVIRKRISSGNAIINSTDDWNEKATAPPVMQLIVDPNMNKPALGQDNHNPTIPGSTSPLKRASAVNLVESDTVGGLFPKRTNSRTSFPLEELNSDFFRKPFKSSEHYTLRLGSIPVIVRDDEIGSIVSYALSSSEYEKQRGENRDACGVSGVPVSLKTSPFEEEEDKSSASSYFLPQRGKTGQDVTIQFSDSNAKFYCKIYYAEHFRMLRKLLFPAGEEVFIRSIASTEAWNPKGGKSGAAFHRTLDKRFILKQMNRFEIQSFLEFAPHYFNYISTAATEHKLTALAKLYGVFRVGYENSKTGRTGKMDLFVMEYMFYKRNVSQVYDLKGSMRNRLVSECHSTHKQPDLVLMDENLLKKAWTNPLYLKPHAKYALSLALANDSHFLASHRVMDYSLLVGVDEDSGELIMGLIDYIRTYTLDKRLETWVKSAVVGASLPTVISPELYQTRFNEAIEIYFPPAPDQWTGLANGDEGAAIHKI